MTQSSATFDDRQPRRQAPAPGLLFTRRPILHRDGRPFAYQLAARSLEEPNQRNPIEDTSRAVASLVGHAGLETLTAGRPAFVELEASQHLEPSDRLRGRVVVEVPGPIEADDRVISACRELRAAGFAVALDEFAMTGGADRLLAHSDFVKLNFLTTPSHAAEACLTAARVAGTGIVAKGIDAPEVFDEAVREGFTHAQGYFFERARPHARKDLAPNRLAALQLLRALGDPNLSIGGLEELIKRDAAMSHRLLRLANSAALAQARHVTSIGHALLLVGRETIRRWASVIVLNDLGQGANAELLDAAVLRAGFCERLAERRFGEDAAGEGFLLGLISLLDVVLERPMGAVVEELPLSAPVVEALLGRENAHRQLLDCLVAYERGEWDACLSRADEMGLDRAALPKAYYETIVWAQTCRAVEAA